MLIIVLHGISRWASKQCLGWPTQHAIVVFFVTFSAEKFVRRLVLLAQQYIGGRNPPPFSRSL